MPDVIADTFVIQYLFQVGLLDLLFTLNLKFFSAQSLRSLRLCGEMAPKTHCRDAEHAEITPRDETRGLPEFSIG